MLYSSKQNLLFGAAGSGKPSTRQTDRSASDPFPRPSYYDFFTWLYRIAVNEAL
jgi:hypothetical protein